MNTTTKLKELPNMRPVVALSLIGLLSTVTCDIYGAELYTSTSFVDQAAEKAVLTASEAKAISQVRATKFRKSTKVVVLNALAFEDKLLTVVTLHGKTLTFRGESIGVGTKGRTRVWSSSSGAVFSWSPNALAGEFRDGEKVYEVLGFFGQYGTISELEEVSFSEPPSMSGSPKQ